MISRPQLALYTALCLLVSLLAIPSGPVLVCRITGEAMKPVLAENANAHGSCCTVSAATNSEGELRYTLTAPGCCDLRQSVERPNVPAISAPVVEIPVAWLTDLPVAASLPRLAEICLTVEVPRDSVPRAPPALSSASPRGPPFSS